MYTQFYGFSNKPFNVILDPTSFQLTTSHLETLTSMIHGIDAGKGFISITGETGIGKTTLIYTLLKHLKNNGMAISISRTNIPFRDLIRNLLSELKLPIIEDNEKTLLQTLNDYLILKLLREENIGIIIDEAQNLPKEGWDELRMLSNLEGSKSKLFQIILMGQPELEVMLDKKQLREIDERIGIRLQLKPLSEKECMRYIDHRLNMVGADGSRIFTPGAISLICYFSKGIPKTINALCDQAFQIGSRISQNKIDETIVKEAFKNMDGLSLQKPIHPEPALLCFAMKISPSIQQVSNSTKDQKRAIETTEFETEPHFIPPKQFPSPLMEEFHQLKHNILRLNNREKNKTILFSGITEGEGNSTVLINFAMTLASEGDRVLLVDGNLRHPSFHNVFRLEKENGLTELSLKKATLMYVIKPTQFSNLSVITCGGDTSNPFAIIESKSLDPFIEEMRSQADWVLFDSPPINSFNDAIALASKIDGVIIVVQAEKTKWEAALHAKQRIESTNRNILGVVLNRRRLYIPEWLYRRL